MAQVVGSQVKLNNGQLVTPQTGGWYDGQQFWNGALSNPGQINVSSNQQGAGQQVSNQVVAQTNPNNVPYIQQQRQVNNVSSVPANTPTVIPGGTPNTSPGGAGMALGNPQPTIDVQSVYNQAFNTPEITTGQAEIDTKTKAYNDANAIINDNPFYSEATRTGKAAKLTQQFNAEMTRLENKQARLKSDAEIKVNLAMKQYDINNQAYKDQLSLFNSLLSAGGLTNASASELANYAVATGIPVSMMEGIIARQKKDEIKPQVITDDNGNVTIIDAMTGSIINKVPGIGNRQGTDKVTATEKEQQLRSTFVNALSNVANSYGHVTPQDWMGALGSWIDNGGVAKDFYNNFLQYTDPNRDDYDQAYRLDLINGQ